MFKLLRALLPSSSKTTGTEGPTVLDAPPPAELLEAGVDPFPLAAHLVRAEGFPYLDWSAFANWLETIDSHEAQARAWTSAEVAWLQHLRPVLGEDFSLLRQGDALLLSSLEPRLAHATLAYMSKTLRRIEHVLAGIAEAPAWGKDILIVFDDDERYYRYVAHYYPEGSFAGSSGMYIHDGCGHFVTMKADLRQIEPVIAHEMTHACLGHLPIPLWLNEGLAVNTEHRLAPGHGTLRSPQEMQEKHLQYWNASRIQAFWSGESFHHSDDGSELSYDLAQRMVARFAANWDTFRDFALSAEAADSGAAAANRHLKLNLGGAAAAMMGREADDSWTPAPDRWPVAQSWRTPSR